jgi:hypothetical protein
MVCHMPGSFLGLAPSSANDADWIERRVRTMSSGYVKVTDVIPAMPPHVRRASGVRLSPGCRSKNCYNKPEKVSTKTHPCMSSDRWINRTLL